MSFASVGKIRDAVKACRSLHYLYNQKKVTSQQARNNKFSLYNDRISILSKMRRNLAAFDFDHTIVDDNSDIVVRNLISKDIIPLSVKKLYKNDGWTAYMQGVFELLHANGHNEDAIINAVHGIKATAGMPELLRELNERHNYDIIIISDANSYLINVWLEKNGLNDTILKVFTNPAKFIKGVLRIEMYHYQTECDLSTKNLCKGRILDEFIASQKEADVFYDNVVYIGDGQNDFCPILRLNEAHLACVRSKYACQELIKAVQSGKPISTTGKKYDVKAKVVFWNNGLDILEIIKADHTKLADQ